MIFDFHPEAQTEFYEAIDYYEECEDQLGYDFAIEVYSAIQNILNHPLAWPISMGTYVAASQAAFPTVSSIVLSRIEYSYLP